jgi:hypothetical protein
MESIGAFFVYQSEIDNVMGMKPGKSTQGRVLKYAEFDGGMK